MIDMERLSKSGFALTGVAVVLCGASVVGVDRMLLKPTVKSSVVLAPYEQAALQSRMVASGVKSWTLASYDGRFVVEEKTPWEAMAVVEPAPTEEVSSEDVEDSELESIRLTGVLGGEDGLEALINHSRVKEGGLVLGYRLVSLTEEMAVIEVSGKRRELRINQEMMVPKVASVPLNLDAVRERSGDWEAIINGQAYRAGDWVDSDTHVRAVMPGKVLLFRGGTLKTLVPDK